MRAVNGANTLGNPCLAYKSDDDSSTSSFVLGNLIYFDVRWTVMTLHTRRIIADTVDFPRPKALAVFLSLPSSDSIMSELLVLELIRLLETLC